MNIWQLTSDHHLDSFSIAMKLFLIKNISLWILEFYRWFQMSWAQRSNRNAIIFHWSCYCCRWLHTTRTMRIKNNPHIPDNRMSPPRKHVTNSGCRCDVIIMSESHDTHILPPTRSLHVIKSGESSKQGHRTHCELSAHLSSRFDSLWNMKRVSFRWNWSKDS